MPKSQDKNLNILRTKYIENFSSLFKGLSLKEIKQFFLEDEIPTLKLMIKEIEEIHKQISVGSIS